MDERLAEWFANEILPHEAALTRYIEGWRLGSAETSDIRQDIYIKVLQAAARSQPPAPRFFLFAVARNHIADLARRRRVVRIDTLQDFPDSSVFSNEVSPEREVGAFQELERLIDAFELLPDRCREVVWLKRVEGASQQDIAARLNIAEGTVEAHLVRGMRLLTQFYGDIASGAKPSGWKVTRNWRRSKKRPPPGS